MFALPQSSSRTGQECKAGEAAEAEEGEFFEPFDPPVSARLFTDQEFQEQTLALYTLVCVGQRSTLKVVKHVPREEKIGEQQNLHISRVALSELGFAANVPLYHAVFEAAGKPAVDAAIACAEQVVYTAWKNGKVEVERCDEKKARQVAQKVLRCILSTEPAITTATLVALKDVKIRRYPNRGKTLSQALLFQQPWPFIDMNVGAKAWYLAKIWTLMNKSLSPTNSSSSVAVVQDSLDKAIKEAGPVVAQFMRWVQGTDTGHIPPWEEVVKGALLLI